MWHLLHGTLVCANFVAVGADNLCLLQLAEDNSCICSLTEQVGDVPMLLRRSMVVMLHNIIRVTLPAISTWRRLLDKANEFLDCPSSLNNGVVRVVFHDEW